MISCGNKAQERALFSLVCEVDLFLKPSGFRQSRKYVWQRDLSWKIEEIDLVLKGATRKHILPSFRVLIPLIKPSELGDQFQHMAQVNLARLLRPDSGPEFDTVVPSISFRQAEFVRSVISDISTSLAWFDQFATPSQCKESLAKYLKPGCPAFLDAMDYLDSMSKDR
jgi:hypothetical protein